MLSNWGPKAFKIFNCWLEHKDSVPFINMVWKLTKVNGMTTYVIKEKLKILKETLRCWNKDVLGKVELELEKATIVLNDLDYMTLVDLKDVSGNIENNCYFASERV